MGNAGSAVPYDIGDECEQFRWMRWKMFEGVSKSEGANKVSVFRFEKGGAPPEDVAMAQNAMKRLKTLKFPHMLQLIDSAETEKEILLVTEPVQPLAVALAEQRDNDKDGEVRWTSSLTGQSYSIPLLRSSADEE